MKLFDITTVRNVNDTIVYNYSTTFKLESDLSIITFTVLSTILCLAAITANFTTMLIVILLPKQTPFTKLFINLATCDILGTIAIYVGDVAFRAGTHWNLPIETCNMLFKIGGTCFSLFFFTSAVTLLVFALMRYIGITKPHSFKSLFESTTKVVLYIVLCWIISLCFTLPTIVCDNAKQRCNNLSIYSPSGCMSKSAYKFCTNYKYIWAGGKASILVIVVFLYLSLSRDLFVRSASFSSSKRNNNTSTRDPGKDKHAFITILILLVILVATGVPYITVKVFRRAYYDQTTISVYNNFVAYFPYINFILDPIVYSIRSSDIHTTYKCLFRQLCSYQKCMTQQERTDNKYTVSHNSHDKPVVIAINDLKTKPESVKDSHVRIAMRDTSTKPELV
ncbi:unnamed protein product [Owenia fusiformis]|uniref:G-protein coupled receptors family 1 profile domain-containing protein n=1 Tax=Owenia fusiformis TaxID=6347 RepID=A0A8S4NH97_OWEFU|nr:unnamed protein product [Owenia fusiformis]